MKDRFDLCLQPRGDHRLSDPISHRRDGCFILPLLPSWVGMFGSVMQLRWSAWSFEVMVPVGTDTAQPVRCGYGAGFAARRG